VWQPSANPDALTVRVHLPAGFEPGSTTGIDPVGEVATGVWTFDAPHTAEVVADRPAHTMLARLRGG
jgi:hypothetical protein